MKNIVIVGFMGTGKTEVSRYIAESLDMKLINTDDLIEKKAGMSINEIFSKKGEQHFRELEKEVVKEISQLKDSVIDTGGGVVMDEENVEDLGDDGLIFCLSATPEEILERTKGYSHRPLLNVSDPVDEIKRLLNKRKEYYERADYQIKTSGKSVTQVAQEIIDIYQTTDHRPQT